MEKYLEKYPDEYQNVMAAIYQLGESKTEEILNQALKLDKKAIFENSEDAYDLMTWHFE